MYPIIVYASISRRTVFEAPVAASLRTGETVLVRPSADEEAPEALIALIDSADVAPHSASAPSSTTRGTLTILAEFSGGQVRRPPSALPYFAGQVASLPREVASAFFGIAATEKDPVTSQIVTPCSLAVGALLTDESVPVVFSAAGFNRHAVMLAQSGSGKSYALGVLLEEIVTKVRRLRVIVIDPNGDFSVMATSLQTVAKTSVGLLSSAQQAIGALADAADGVSLTVLGFDSDAPLETGCDAATGLLQHLWSMREDRAPTLIVIDEAHSLSVAVPGQSDRVALPILVTIAGEGRKYGLWLLLATQRPQKLHPSLISQCDNLMLMRISSPLDLTHVASSFGGITPELTELAGGFGKGDCLALGRIVRAPTLLHFRKRTTPESGGDLSLEWATCRISSAAQ